MKLIGFLPCRAGSERVKNKNTRQFAGYEHGLLELKLRQLQNVPALDQIIVSSNDDVVLDFCSDFADRHDARVRPLPRPDAFGNSATSMSDFIVDYIAHIENDGHLIWTHVTHPFVTSEIYNHAIQQYKDCLLKGYDSLVGATKIQKFLWRDGKPFNYDNTQEKWPRSQDLEPLYEINHAIYAVSFPVIRDVGDRIGNKPYFFEMEESQSMDIDWEDQFFLMNEIAAARADRGMSLI